MPKTPDPETLRLAAEVLVDAPGLERGPTTDHCLEVAAWLVAQANLLEQQGKSSDMHAQFAAQSSTSGNDQAGHG